MDGIDGMAWLWYGLGMMLLSSPLLFTLPQHVYLPPVASVKPQAQTSSNVLRALNHN